MILELTISMIIQIMVVAIMIFTLGLQLDVIDDTRKVARYILGNQH